MRGEGHIREGGTQGRGITTSVSRLRVAALFLAVLFSAEKAAADRRGDLGEIGGLLTDQDVELGDAITTAKEAKFEGRRSTLLSPGSVVTLQGGAHGKYCRSGTDSSTACLSDRPGVAGKFTVIGMGGGYIALKVSLPSFPLPPSFA